MAITYKREVLGQWMSRQDLKFTRFTSEPQKRSVMKKRQTYEQVIKAEERKAKKGGYVATAEDVEWYPPTGEDGRPIALGGKGKAFTVDGDLVVRGRLIVLNEDVKAKKRKLRIRRSRK